MHVWGVEGGGGGRREEGRGERGLGVRYAAFGSGAGVKAELERGRVAEGDEEEKEPAFTSGVRVAAAIRAGV